MRGPKTLKNVSRILRTAHLLDKLLATTGLTWKEIDERVRENQYAAFGLHEPSLDTVQAYFKLARPPGVDRRAGLEVPWLMAVAREFPGSYTDFFHPLFDTLFGTEVSNVPAEFAAARIPEAWIREEEESERGDVAEFLRAFGRRQGEAAPERRKTSNSASAIEEVHRLMLRLPPRLFMNLFHHVGEGEHLARSFQPIERDVALMLEHDSLDGLAGLLMLFRESAAMGDLHRCKVTRTAVETFLPRLPAMAECRRIHGPLTNAISNFCCAEAPPLYTLGMSFQAGLPRSWQDPVPRPQAFMPGHRRGDQPDSIEYYAETGVSLAALRERSDKVAVREQAARRYKVGDERIAALWAGRPASTTISLFRQLVAAVEEIPDPIKHVSMPTYEAFGRGENWVLLFLRSAHVLVVLLRLPSGRTTGAMPTEFSWGAARRCYLSSRDEIPEALDSISEHLHADQESELE
jgi:hypothetical protein